MVWYANSSAKRSDEIKVEDSVVPTSYQAAGGVVYLRSCLRRCLVSDGVVGMRGFVLIDRVDRLGVGLP
eukprot:418399-Rhodomonas_salina.1